MLCARVWVPIAVRDIGLCYRENVAAVAVSKCVCRVNKMLGPPRDCHGCPCLLLCLSLPGWAKECSVTQLTARVAVNVGIQLSICAHHILLVITVWHLCSCWHCSLTCCALTCSPGYTSGHDSCCMGLCNMLWPHFYPLVLLCCHEYGL